MQSEIIINEKHVTEFIFQIRCKIMALLTLSQIDTLIFPVVRKELLYSGNIISSCNLDYAVRKDVGTYVKVFHKLPFLSKYIAFLFRRYLRSAL